MQIVNYNIFYLKYCIYLSYFDKNAEMPTLVK